MTVLSLNKVVYGGSWSVAVCWSGAALTFGGPCWEVRRLR